MRNLKENNKYWWQEEVIYQIYPKSFKDSNNDGIGDIKGITEKLDYLKDLGVTMIWICPIYKSPMVDNGYDISDYKDINPEFGTMEDFDDMMEKAKELNIKVILDLVINHTSDEHPWFKEAIANPDSKYRDYYIFKKSNEGAPNNWRSIFGGSSWEKVPNEEVYYLHVFDKKQPDLNWENPDLREELYEMINWWLVKGLAGFRVDAITFIKKDQDYKNMPSDGVDGLASVKLKSRNRPGIEVFLKELNERTFKKHNCVTVGEAPGVPYEEYNQYIGEGGYFSMIFDFHYADIDVESGIEWFKRTNWTVKELKEKIFKSQQAFKGKGWGANFIENHDQPRSLSKYICDEKWQNAYGAKALGAMYFFLRGTPFIYQGQEIGMKNFSRKSIDEFNDISSIDNYYRAIEEGYSKEEALHFVNLRSRDNSRTPFQWSKEENSGFCETAKPWLALVEHYKSITLEDQKDDLNSVFNFYKEMIKLRHNSQYKELLVYGDIEEIKNVPDSVVAYKRFNEHQSIESYTNLSTESQIINDVTGNILLNNDPDLVVEETKKTLILKPYQTVLVKRG